MSTGTDTVYVTLSDTLQSKFNTPADEITPTTTIGDLELDSLALAELAVVLSEELGVTVTEDGITADTSLAEFTEHIAAHVRTGGDSA